MSTFFIEIIINAILVGLIWTIQLINYPSLIKIEGDTFNSIHQYHMRSITPLVAPLMITELLLCLVNTLYYSVVPIIFLIFIWLTTFLLSVPIHNQLSIGKNEKLLQRLITTNWLRTLSWTAKLIAMMIIFTQEKQ